MISTENAEKKLPSGLKLLRVLRLLLTFVLIISCKDAIVMT